MPSRRKLWRVSDAEFRDLRLGCLLSQRACAEFLGVAVRTVRAWDRGRVRVPWAVVRLLRLLRCGELDGISKPWAGWLLRGDRLVSPEGWEFRPHEMNYWGNTVAMAHLWRSERAAARPSAGSGLPVAEAVADANPAPAVSPAELLLLLVAVGLRGGQAGGRAAPPAGLVSFGNKSYASEETAERCGVQPGHGWEQVKGGPVFAESLPAPDHLVNVQVFGETP